MSLSLRLCLPLSLCLSSLSLSVCRSVGLSVCRSVCLPATHQNCHFSTQNRPTFVNQWPFWRPNWPFGTRKSTQERPKWTPKRTKLDLNHRYVDTSMDRWTDVPKYRYIDPSMCRPAEGPICLISVLGGGFWFLSRLNDRAAPDPPPQMDPKSIIFVPNVHNPKY